MTTTLESKGNLNTRAMLVSLNVSQWTARKHDRKISLEVDIAHGTDNAGRFHKRLLTGEYKIKLKEIQKHVNSIRSYHYEHTLPWLDNGARILTAKSFQKYHLTMLKMVEDFKDAVRSFADVYDHAIQQAQQDLNGMFNAKDYPATKADLTNRFGASVSYMPLPSSPDFRVGLSDEMVKEIKGKITSTVASAEGKAMKDLWARLYSPVKHMAETLKDDGKVFRDSLIKNLTDICAILPELNIADDSDLEDKRQLIERELCSLDPKELRDDSDHREIVAQKATDIANVMAGYMGA
jgi:hypothetical protein